MDRASREKISKNTEDLNHLDLTDIYRTLHKTKAEYTLFSRARETFSRIDHLWGHQKSLNKFKKTEIIQSIVCRDNGMKLKINSRGEKNPENSQICGKLNNTLKQPICQNRNHKKNWKHFEKIKTKIQHTKTHETQQKRY